MNTRESNRSSASDNGRDAPSIDTSSRRVISVASDTSQSAPLSKPRDPRETGHDASDTSRSAASSKPRVPRRLRSDASNASQSMASSKPRVPHKACFDVSYTVSRFALESIEPGVDFLVGSGVFVECIGALYLAKMLKKRFSGDRMEYFVSFDGFKSIHDGWVSIRNIYEINPQTKRAFKFINSVFFSKSDNDKARKRAPPDALKSKRRETRRRKKDDAENSQTRSGDTRSAQPAVCSARTFEMQDVRSGVNFLPGSTIFAEYKGGLCLAKMVKKRGRGEFMEYFIQYVGLKTTEKAWVTTALLYEINPQTKRMFRVLGVKK